MKLVVRIVSFLLLVAAVAAVFLYDGGKPKTDDTPPPRTVLWWTSRLHEDARRPNPPDQGRRILANLIWYNTRHEETSGNKESGNGAQGNCSSRTWTIIA